jgi:hypothetical protein
MVCRRANPGPNRIESVPILNSCCFSPAEGGPISPAANAAWPLIQIIAVVKPEYHIHFEISVLVDFLVRVIINLLLKSYLDYNYERSFT